MIRRSYPCSGGLDNVVGRDLPARHLERASIGRVIVRPRPAPNFAQFAESFLSCHRARSLDGGFLPRGRCCCGGILFGGVPRQRGVPAGEGIIVRVSARSLSLSWGLRRSPRREDRSLCDGFGHIIRYGIVTSRRR